MSYRENKQRAQTRTTKPSLTEQSAANETDINVIVAKFKITGRVPGSQQEPLSGDFTQLPRDLRGFIDLAKSMKNLKSKLPKELRDIPDAKLLALTPDQLKNILTPPAPKPASEETK